jgi:hypothetical protein
MGKLAEIKTKPTSSSVDAFIDSLPDEQKRKDSQVICKMMEKAMKEKPKMWGSSMIGFGDKRYKSPATGREVDWFKIGFSPRKANLSGCLYINKLEDVDVKVLEKMIAASAK